MNSTIVYDTEGLKISYKMKQGISRVEKKYGAMNRRFFIEHDECNRVGRGFYDGCQLTCDLVQSRNIMVAHDGTISY